VGIAALRPLKYSVLVTVTRVRTQVVLSLPGAVRRGTLTLRDGGFSLASLYDPLMCEVQNAAFWYRTISIDREWTNIRGQARSYKGDFAAASLL
jgi:hypothetical protein